MAIYHMSVKIGSRSNGKSAVASASYRSAEKLHDERENKDFNYTRKQSVVHTEIVLPKNAPALFLDREKLWNTVELNEKQSNAQLYREFEISLPNECSKEDKIAMAREMALSLAREGMCVDFSIHDVKKGQYKTKNERATNDNCHVHMMCTMRAIDEKNPGHFLPKRIRQYKLDAHSQKIPVLDKNGQQKIEKKTGRKIYERTDIRTVNWDSKEKVIEWRQRWENIANKYLSDDKKIDSRTLAKQKESAENKLNIITKELKNNERTVRSIRGREIIRQRTKKMAIADARTRFAALPDLQPGRLADARSRVSGLEKKQETSENDNVLVRNDNAYDDRRNRRQAAAQNNTIVQNVRENRDRTAADRLENAVITADSARRESANRSNNSVENNERKLTIQEKINTRNREQRDEKRTRKQNTKLRENTNRNDSIQTETRSRNHEIEQRTATDPAPELKLPALDQVEKSIHSAIAANNAIERRVYEKVELEYDRTHTPPPPPKLEDEKIFEKEIENIQKNIKIESEKVEKYHIEKAKYEKTSFIMKPFFHFDKDLQAAPGRLRELRQQFLKLDNQRLRAHDANDELTKQHRADVEKYETTRKYAIKSAVSERLAKIPDYQNNLKNLKIYNTQKTVLTEPKKLAELMIRGEKTVNWQPKTRAGAHKKAVGARNIASAISNHASKLASALSALNSAMIQASSSASAQTQSNEPSFWERLAGKGVPPMPQLNGSMLNGENDYEKLKKLYERLKDCAPGAGNDILAEIDMIQMSLECDL